MKNETIQLVHHYAFVSLDEFMRCKHIKFNGISSLGYVY